MNRPAAIAALSRYVLRPAQWDANAEAWSRHIPCDNPGGLSAILADEVLSGRAKLAHIESAGVPVGFVAFTVTPRHELLVHAAYARDGAETRCLLPAIFPLLDALALQCECDTIRFHTMRPGLIVRAQSNGFRVSEVIMRRDVRRG